MSAYLCDDQHIKQLAAYLVSCNQRPSDRDRLARRVGYIGQATVPKLASYIATVLLDENENSLAARYGDEPEGRKLAVTLGEVMQMERCDAAKIHKAVQCYEYQACETADYYDSLAHKICGMINEAALQSLPGFEDANWGAPLPDAPPAAKVVSLMEICR